VRAIGAEEARDFGLRFAGTPDDLDKLVADSDILSLHLPLLPETRHIIDARRLALMKPSAFLINVARGALVDEAALIDVLKDHKIAGAALDVFTEEPLPKDSPFWTLENVLITPHTAAVTDRLWERHNQLIGENLRRFLDGKPLLNLIDKRRGY